MQTPRRPRASLMDQIRRGNYDSGQDYVLEYGELRFTFNERDFSERVEQAARKLGFVGNPLEDTELEDLVNLTVNGEVVDPASGLGEHVNDCWPDLVGPADRSLVHWLRRLVFRSAWLDQRVKEGELDVVFDDATHTFGYVQPERDREPIELSPEPSWRRVAYGPSADVGTRGGARRRADAAWRRPRTSPRASRGRAALARCAAGFDAARGCSAALGGALRGGRLLGRRAAWPRPRPASWPPRPASCAAGFAAARLGLRRRLLRRGGFVAAALRLALARGSRASSRSGASGRRASASTTGSAAPRRARPARRGARRPATRAQRLRARLADQQLRAQRARLAQRERRERARRGRPRGRARRRSSRRRPAPATVAITVSEPPPARLRPAASARRAAPPAGTRSRRSARRRRRRGRRRGGRSRPPARRPAPARPTDAAKLSAAPGATGKSAISSGRTPASTARDLEPRRRRQRAGEPAQRLALARARRAGDDHARALAERRQPLDRLDRRVLGAELRCARPARRPAGPRSACPRRPPRPGGR